MRARLAIVALSLTALTGCPPPGTTCNDDVECEDRWGEGSICVIPDGEPAGVCARPCREDSTSDCESGDVCVDGVCVAEGATDAGPDDAGPDDAGPDDAGPLDAGPVDGGPQDGGPQDAGFDAGPQDAGQCVPDAGQCPNPANGTNTCVNGVCQLSCDTDFKECPGAAGVCTSLTTTTDCGDCDIDVSATADSCATGTPTCGGAAECTGVTGKCVADALGAYSCVQCAADMDCGGGEVCCEGECRGGGEDANCGCDVLLNGTNGAGVNCSIQATDLVCISDTCGCDTSGDEQCGTDGTTSLEGLCDTGQSPGACLAQDGDNCGAVGAVVPAGGGAAVAGSCDPSLGGDLCLPATTDGGPLGTCGCSVEDDCTGPVLDGDGVPRIVADACDGPSSSCECLGATRCTNEDCTDDGCVNLQNNTQNCGVLTNNCELDARGTNGGGAVCRLGGCECDAPTDCDNAPENVDVCLDQFDGLGGRCVCDDFTDSGTKRACPAGLACLTGGCEYPAGSTNTYATMVLLKGAMDL